VEATDTRITIRAINQEWLAAACVQQRLEEHLEDTIRAPTAVSTD